MRKIAALVLIVFFITACVSDHEKASSETRSRAISENALTMATLYTYYAHEYRALAYQAFNIARERVDEIRMDDPYNENLAIVVDIDETVLDNSPFEALMIAGDTSYPYMWNEWCELADAGAVPGALEFLQYADSIGFSIFYVSNRKDKYVKEGTMENLTCLGFPQIEAEHFLLRLEKSDENPNPSDKQLRRDGIIVNGYEIVLLIGDNLGDFYMDASENNTRREQLDSFEKAFGHKFIILPNAMYGNWPGSIGATDAASMDSLLLEMVKVFE